MRGTPRQLALLLALAWLPAMGASANDSAGTTAAEFLKIENGVRAAGLGGAYAALARDPTGGLYFNPAGLGLIPRNEAAASYNSAYQGLDEGYAAYGHRFARGGGLAGGIMYMSAASQPRTEASPDGGYNITGSFTPTGWVVSAGYGLAFLDERGALGLAVKEVDESMGSSGNDRQDPDDSGSAAAVDFGGLARFWDKRLSLGLAYQNLGTKMRGYDLPAALRAGLGLELGPVTGAFDIVVPKADTLSLRLGLEYSLLKALALRVGYNSGIGRAAPGGRAFKGGFATGIGLRLLGFGFDYAFVPYGDLGDTHRVGISYRWGDKATGQGPSSPKAQDVLRSPEGARHPGPGPSPAAPPPEPQPAPCPQEAELAAATLSEKDAELEAKFMRAERAIAAGDYARAMQELNYSSMMLGFDDPRQVRYHETWGRIMYFSRNPSAAKPSYVDAIRAAARLGLRQAKVADAYYGLARCLLAEGETQGAAGALRKALEACPSPSTRLAVESQLRRLSGEGR